MQLGTRFQAACVMHPDVSVRLGALIYRYSSPCSQSRTEGGGATVQVTSCSGWTLTVGTQAVDVAPCQ